MFFMLKSVLLAVTNAPISTKLLSSRIDSILILAELADVHPTYIGQVERGEKNVTIESLEKICCALNLPMDELFYNIHTSDAKNQDAKACYDLIVRQPLKDQKQLCLIIEGILKFRS